jgi:hypothetical protein
MKIAIIDITKELPQKVVRLFVPDACFVAEFFRSAFR